MYFYIKAEALDELKEMWEARDKAPYRLEKDDKTGESYVAIYASPLDPTFAMEEIPGEFIDRVTVREEISNYNCFRIEGVYRLNEAILMCHLHSWNVGGFDSKQTLTKMFVNISSPNLKALQEIYSQFRQGKLYPEENWESPQISPDSEEEPENEEITPKE